ncbi:MAG: TIGR00282 family metallophosphoesterase [Kiritimatiellae bacterium]|nr:TIGR00282 family metallophosphoesterase [Kiritimatiellia bacterium]
MKVLLVGDVVGSPGRRVFANTVARMKATGKVDFVVVNAENAAGGRGLTAPIADELFSAGADAITLGDHTWDQKEFVDHLDRDQRIARPLNFAPGCPGRGCVTFDTKWGEVAVVNLIGRVFMRPYDCPFRAIDALLAQECMANKIIIVDMHAEATSEKIVIGRYLDGRVTCVVGSHTHVQTSDEVVLPQGTAYITDLGMTGSKDSAIGRDLESITQNFLNGMPAKFKMANEDIKLEGVLVDINEKTGKARGIKRLREGL